MIEMTTGSTKSAMTWHVQLLGSKIKTCFNDNSSKPLPVLKSTRENEMKQVGFAVVFQEPNNPVETKTTKLHNGNIPNR